MTLTEIIENASQDTTFVAGMSSNELWYGTDTNTRLTDVCATIAQEVQGKAETIHSHTGYAAEDHTHTGFAAAEHSHAGYAAVSHSHDSYAEVNHTHTGYAAENHSHAGYAAADHTHDYAASGHTHTPASIGAAASNHSHSGYAAATHTHDYAATDHTHSNYAAANHTHDYAASEHTHTPASIGAAAANHSHTVDSALSETSTNPVQNKVVSAALAGKAASSHTHSEYAATSHTHDYAASGHTHTPASIGAAASSHSHSAATTSAAGMMSASDKSKLDGIATGANKTTVDSALSSTSTNPVQNKVISSALAGKAAASHTHDYAASGHTHTPASIGAAAASHTHDYLPTTGGTVNGEVNVAGVLRVQGQQSFYFQTSTNSQTVGTNNATGGTTICCGPSADVAINGANVKTHNILPRSTNAHTLGNTSSRWKGIYSTAAVNVSSDERSKRDIAPLDGADLAAFIEKLDVVRYNYKEDEAGANARIGLVAQDVQRADAELAKFFVSEDENGMLGLTPADLVFPLIAAVQELTRRVRELENK